MDVDFVNKDFGPKTDYMLLKQQVIQQSSSCDIKVKCGQWEKLYHRSVLAKSPFFQHMMSSKFQESYTGTVEMVTGTPGTIDLVLMFLYGEDPKLDLKNIGSVVELAEFLMMENLKSFCIKWLRKVSVERLTDDISISLLQLSTVYNFTVPSLTTYIDGHLLSLLHNPQVVSLDTQSVEYILLDRRFGYVPMDDKLKFIERWFHFNKDTISLQWITAIVKKLNLLNASKTILEDLVQRSPFDGIDCLKDALINFPKLGCNNRKVLIMPDDDVDTCFWGLDLQQKHWYRIDPSRLTGKHMKSTVLSLSKAGLRSSSELYFVNFRKIKGGGKRSSISCLNFATGECNMYRVVLEFKPPCCYIKHFSMAGDLCFASININDESKSVVYAGAVGRKSIHLSQFFSLRKGKIWQMCVNQSSVLAIIPNSNDRVLLYDFNDLDLAEILLEFCIPYSINPTRNGFIFNNLGKCIAISRLCGPSLSSKYLLKEFFYQYFWSTACGEYIIESPSNPLWFHQDHIQSERIIKIASVDDILYSENPVEWVRYPFPDDNLNELGDSSGKSYSYIRLIKEALLQKNMIIVEIPTEKLKCELNCPHCKVIHPELDESALYDSDYSKSSNKSSSCESSVAFVSSEDECSSEIGFEDESTPEMFYIDDSSSADELSDYDFW